MTKKEIITAGIISVIIIINLIAANVIKDITRELKNTNTLATQAMNLQEQMSKNMSALNQLNAGNEKIAQYLKKTSNDISKMSVVISYVENRNKKMKEQELGIDVMEKKVVRNLPILVNIANNVLGLEDGLLQTVNNLNTAGQKAKTLEEELLKITKRKVRIMKKIPDGGFF